MGKKTLERDVRAHAAGYKTDICEKERDTTQDRRPSIEERKRKKESKINDKTSAIRISW